MCLLSCVFKRILELTKQLLLRSPHQQTLTLYSLLATFTRFGHIGVFCWSLQWSAHCCSFQSTSKVHRRWSLGSLPHAELLLPSLNLCYSLNTPCPALPQFELLSRTWLGLSSYTESDMPSPRTAASLSSLNSSVFLFGGSGEGGRGTFELKNTKFQIIIILWLIIYVWTFWSHPLTLVCWVKNHGSPHWFWQFRDTTWRSSIKPSYAVFGLTLCLFPLNFPAQKREAKVVLLNLQCLVILCQSSVNHSFTAQCYP